MKSRAALEAATRCKTRELERAEEALRESEALIRSVSDNLPDGLIYQIVRAPDGSRRFTYVSDAVRRLHGCTAEEAIQDASRMYASVVPEELPRIAAEEEAANATLSDFRTEARIISPTGEVRWSSFASRPRRLPDGSTSWAGVEIDITDRKRVEAEKQALQDQLMAANQELAQALRLKDEFLSSMSHELRTPLNAILLFLQVIQEQVYGPISEPFRRAATMTEASGKHLLDLINDILDLSKIQAGRLKLEMGVVPVSSLVEGSLQMVEKTAQRKGIQLVVSLDPKAPTLVADGRRLKQMLVNLLSNAVKFTAEGGRVEVTVAGDRLSKVIKFVVSDNGVGIPEGQLPRLFQPFTQVDSTLSRSYSGTGLGLSLVLSMAVLHGGGVDVKSEVGKGSSFTILLPWRDRAELTAPQADGSANGRPLLLSPVKPAPGPTPHQRAGRILIVEDNDSNALVLSDFLSASGHQTWRAPDAHQGLALIKELQPDVVLMDIQMPGMDGLEAIRQIRSREETKRVPIFAVTALAMPGDRERCLSAGADEYYTKPLDLVALLCAIEKSVAG